MEKRYYWIKLKTNFFEQETIDFLMSQKNGSDYIVLYQMLCLMTANNNGELSSTVGEMIVPYDVNKIVRDTKYFNVDTVTVALELFKRLGLIYYKAENNSLQIANHGEMVGSEVTSAHRVREYRQRKALQCNNDVTQENKSIDIRDKDNKKLDKENKRFVRPSVNEVAEFCFENNLNVDAQAFIDYYESNGWKVGKNSMKDWKATCRNWSRREGKETKQGNLKSKPSYDLDAIKKKSVTDDNYLEQLGLV